MDALDFEFVVCSEPKCFNMVEVSPYYTGRPICEECYEKLINGIE